MHRVFRRLLSAAILLIITPQLQAGLFVAIGDLSLAPGGTGFVDVAIRSDEVAGTSLNLFNFQFQIDTSGPTRLEFVDPQPDPQLALSGYVFASDSFDQTFGIPVGTVGTTVVPNDTFTGGDSTASGSDVTVTVDRLLVRLQVTAGTFAPPAPGDLFTIQLVAGPNSFFDSLQSSGIAFVSQDGTVTINDLQPVPEPGSLTLFALAGCSLLAFGWFKRRKLDCAGARA